MKFIFLFLGFCLSKFAAKDHNPGFPENDNSLTWSDSTRLTWNDYQKVSRSDSFASATTGTIRRDCKCINGIAEIKVAALFSKEKSWVLLKDTNNLELLKHEQLHFDIAEVYARLCRKKLKTMSHSCSNIHALETQARLATWFQEAENLKYDRESNHYKNKAGQEKWNDKVALWLKNLEEFKN